MSAAASLSPYEQCPMGSPHSCRFSEALHHAPQIAGPGVGAAKVHQCATCGHGVSRPPIPDVSVLYEGRETQDYQNVDGSFAQLVKTIVFDRQAKELLRQIGRTPQVLVDFACGSGLLTSRIAAALPAESKVFALDFFDEPPREMRGVDYRSFTQAAGLEGGRPLSPGGRPGRCHDSPHPLNQRTPDRPVRPVRPDPVPPDGRGRRVLPHHPAIRSR